MIYIFLKMVTLTSTENLLGMTFLTIAFFLWRDTVGSIDGNTK